MKNLTALDVNYPAAKDRVVFWRDFINFTDSNIANVVVKTGTTFWKMSVNCRYVHEVQHFFYDQTHKPLILNWDPKS